MILRVRHSDKCVSLSGPQFPQCKNKNSEITFLTSLPALPMESPLCERRQSVFFFLLFTYIWRPLFLWKPNQVWWKYQAGCLWYKPSNGAFRCMHCCGSLWTWEQVILWRADFSWDVFLEWRLGLGSLCIFSYWHLLPLWHRCRWEIGGYLGKK